MRRCLKKVVPVVLSFAVAGSMVLPNVAGALGDFDLDSSVVHTPINEYRADLAPGVKEKHYSFEGSDGKKIESFVVEVDVQNPSVSIEAGTPDDGEEYGLQPVRQQASAADGENHKVVAAVNADFYNMATGEPNGILFKDGVGIKDQLRQGWGFFGIKKSGEAVIGSTAEYDVVKDQLQEALGGNAILVKDSQVYQTPKTGAGREPRTAVGIKADGSVFFTVIDGRQEPYSSGISMPDLAQLMIDLGAVTALNLDGGGSSTFTTRTLGGDDLEIDNMPSDRGERSVANSWLVVLEEPSDHTFDSAYVYPYDQSFTPGSTIDFGAKGRDKSMASAPLPDADLSWELSDASFGTIDENGVFQSNGKTGQFHAVLNHQGKEVGKSIIEIAAPDKISFSSPELTAARNSEIPLGFQTKYEKRIVDWKLEDIEFDIPEGLGTIDEEGVLHTGDESVSGTITARLKGTDLTAQLRISVGMLPQVLFDFEEDLGTWKTSTANRGEKGSLTLAEYPEPVRFGDQSLKLDYDFTGAQTGTTLGVYAGPGVITEIEGDPQSIGMWVYATPEAHGYWLRMLIVDGNNKNQSVNLTAEKPGIDWVGWKYIEAEIPASFTGPFKISGTQAIRMMSTKSGITGPMTKGSLYIDNIRAVYGEKVDDLYPPVIESINAEDKEYTNSSVNIKADVREYEDDPYKTGIDWEKIKLYVDGKEYSKRKGHFSYDMDGSISLSGLGWADGTHQITLMVPDKFGNQAVKTAYFTVNTGSPKIEIVQAEEKAYLGDTFELAVKATNPAEISESALSLKVDRNFTVEDTIFSPGFAGSTSSYDDKTGILTLHLENSGKTVETEEAAIIPIRVPASTKEGSKVNLELIEGETTYVQPWEETFIPTYSMKPLNVEVEAALKVEAEPLLIGEPAHIQVIDQEGKPVSGAEVFATIEGNDKLLGKTNDDGSLLVDSLTNEIRNISLFSVKDGKYSFKMETQTYPALVEEDEIKNIISPTTDDPYKSKSFTWMSSPLGKGETPVIQYARKNDYDKKGDKGLLTAKGSWSNQVFSGELDITKNGIARVNQVTLKKLKQDTTYVYRVGNGETWSDMQEFTTLKRKNQFEFSVLGDTQSPSDLSLFDQILSNINGQDPAFMIHVGDLVDESSKFTQWDDVLGVMSQYDNIRTTNLVSALGNHEYMGDSDASTAKAILGSPANGPDTDKGGTYSVDYHNMHISVLGFTSDDKVLDQQLEWLKKDMNSSDKPWKILVTHKPPYYTNPFGGNEIMKEKLPPVADELGIDIVFSGHDHAYGRTKKLREGKEDENGTVYVVAGTTGRKHYDAVADEKFEYVNMENIAVYMSAKVDKDTITFITRTSDGDVIDEFSVLNEEYDLKDAEEE
ncbi:phosphodiester glycosidase family protein [Rossellomorea oryzaecorticis]|uniref:Phosphodiester glycosidase family protein n=1 Tax=Rossellomorea oryzaecorticis TaxID=1396505 RepID=A0ABW8VV30_9BACI|nr:phosphodiester glycosidase family protein [[Bacillus] enclensis]MBH9964797.1 phosphodiester glycosidase family protein [[Bacillus] enclensis]